MVRVKRGGSLQTSGSTDAEFEVEAANIYQLLQGLGKSYPVLRAMLDQGVAVSIDGQIYNGARFQKIPEGAEVFLLPKLVGG